MKSNINLHLYFEIYYKYNFFNKVINIQLNYNFIQYYILRFINNNNIYNLQRILYLRTNSFADVEGDDL